MTEEFDRINIDTDETGALVVTPDCRRLEAELSELRKATERLVEAMNEKTDGEVTEALEAAEAVLRKGTGDG